MASSPATTLKLALPPAQTDAVEGVGCWLNVGPFSSVVIFVLQVLLQLLLSVIVRLRVNEFAPPVLTVTFCMEPPLAIEALPLGEEAEIDQL